MLDSIPASVLDDWRAYASIEPFGALADFWRSGMIASVLANIHRQRGASPARPADFMPESIVAGAQPAKTAEQLYWEFKNWALLNKDAQP
jgi:hypothetical protein